MQGIYDWVRVKLRVISHSGKPYRDRVQAGYLLAREVADLRRKKAVVLGIPRGGIIVARELANFIEGDLDIVLSRKLGAPGQSELAMGSLAEGGKVFLNQEIIRSLGVSQWYIEQETTRQMAEIQRRSQFIRNTVPKIPLTDRTVVVTDDGVATGATMQAALWAVRHENPHKLVVAIPVASGEALERLSPDVDEIVCLRQPPFFYAVGQFFRQFPQVEDEEVIRILEDEAQRRRQTSRPPVKN